METVLAFAWMAQQNCDIAVVECGMGGREDATNIISTTAVSVLTSIGMDHMKFLGDTIQDIARAKGGIIKPQIPAVLQGQAPEVEREIRTICQQQNSSLTVVQGVSVTRADEKSVTFDYGEMQDVTVRLPGAVQAKNAATAIAAVQSLAQFPVTQQQIREGLLHTSWKGRMEQICDTPVLVIDGAHNPNAAKQLREEALRRWKAGGIVEIVGVLADKDFTEVGRLLAPLAKKIFTVTPNNPRALSAQDLAQCFRQFCDDVTPADSPAQAWQRAKQEQLPVLAFGSLSWLRELRDAVEEQT